MSKIFLSYRRKESADFVGRLFDRLSGYFGPDCISMDVDTLISGMDYREEIDKIITNCQVFLAVIGQQWSSIADETGQRRLDNPDDQLRIEVATALKRGATIVPVLIHGARMPSTEDLPLEIRGLAAAQPIEIQSGMAFNTDMRKLIDRLEQKHGLSNPDRRFPLHLVLMPLGILLTAIGCGLALGLPYLGSYAAARIPGGPIIPGRDVSLSGYESELLNTLLYCTIPLGLGPLLIVLGSRWCCLNKERRREQLHFSSGIGTRPSPKSNLSVGCLALGLAALGTGLIAAVPAFILGVWAWIDIRRRPGWVRGRSLVVVGLLAAIVGGVGTTALHLSYWRFHSWLSAVERAETAQAAGDPNAAMSAYMQAIEVYPGEVLYSGVCHLARSRILLNSADRASALEELSKAINKFENWQDSPADTDARMTLELLLSERSKLYRDLGETRKADNDQERLDQLRPLFQLPGGGGQNDLFQVPPAPAEMPPAPVADPKA